MDPGLIADLSRAAFIAFLKAGLPVMLAGLAVGFVISLMQALTQIQEQTLVYVPKIVAVLGALLLLLPFMAQVLNSYMERIALAIATGH